MWNIQGITYLEVKDASIEKFTALLDRTIKSLVAADVDQLLKSAGAMTVPGESSVVCVEFLASADSLTAADDKSRELIQEALSKTGRDLEVGYQLLSAALMPA